MFKLLRKDIEEVPNTFIQELINSTPQFTPDMAELESRMYHFVFIPDECMMTLPKHDMVKEGASGFYPFYERCYTSQEFCFLNKKLGKESFPIALKPLNNPELSVCMNRTARVQGELYALTANQIKLLDNHKQNTVRFNRVMVNINVPTFRRKKIETQYYNGRWECTYDRTPDFLTTISSHMYLGREEYWLDQLLDKDGFWNFEPVTMTEVDRVWIKNYFNYKQHN